MAAAAGALFKVMVERAAATGQRRIYTRYANTAEEARNIADRVASKNVSWVHVSVYSERTREYVQVLDTYHAMKAGDSYLQHICTVSPVMWAYVPDLMPTIRDVARAFGVKEPQ